MSAGKYDITIDQGSDFELTLVIKDGGSARDLGGWNARGKLKSTYDAAQSYDFTFTGIGGGSLGDDGTVVMKMANTVSDDIAAVVVQTPNFFGFLEDIEEIKKSDLSNLIVKSFHDL